MRAFVGWVPTVTGRLSFSRIGDEHVGDRIICNNTATLAGDGFLFGSQTRTSHDGPFPAWVMRVFGRVPDVHYMVSLSVEKAELPIMAPKAQADDPAKAPVMMEQDLEGALRGEIVFFSKGRVLPQPLNDAIRTFRRLAREGRAPSCRQEKRRKSIATRNGYLPLSGLISSHHFKGGSRLLASAA